MKINTTFAFVALAAATALTGCSAQFTSNSSIFGIWFFEEVTNTDWDGGAETLHECATEEVTLTLDKEGTFSREEILREPQSDACGQPTGFREEANSDGTFVVFDADRDGMTYIHFWQEFIHWVAFDDNTMVWESQNGETFQYIQTVASGSDSEGKFLILNSDLYREAE